jgi:hypothetical protein
MEVCQAVVNGVDVGCGIDLPKGRPFKLCADCNRAYIGKRYFQVAAGFKNNGASVVPEEAVYEHMKDQVIRG